MTESKWFGPSPRCIHDFSVLPERLHFLAADCIWLSSCPMPPFSADGTVDISMTLG